MERIEWGAQERAVAASLLALASIIAPLCAGCAGAECPAGLVEHLGRCVGRDAGDGSDDDESDQELPVSAQGGSGGSSAASNDGDKAGAAGMSAAAAGSASENTAGTQGGPSGSAGQNNSSGAGGQPAGAAGSPAASMSIECADDERACDGTCVAKDDPGNCGECGNDCLRLANVRPSVACRDGQCVLDPSSCSLGWANCNGNLDDGCESSLGEPEHCGECDLRCDDRAPLCSGSMSTAYVCATGCAAENPTKCGQSCVDLMDDPLHCGGCNAACTAPANADVRCESGICTSTCRSGYHECNGSCADDGSVRSCGTRCEPCPTVANGTSTCNGTSCGIDCNAGYHRCEEACASDNDVATCGTRCDPCPTVPNGTVVCTSGACDVRCNAGFHERDGACAPNDTPSCCGRDCESCSAAANAEAFCERGECSLRCSENANRCNDSCVARSCELGETCSEADSCKAGLTCMGGRCESSAPVCGDGEVSRPEEECEVDANGATAFTCGPEDAPADKRCKNRTVYTTCNVSGASCGPGTECQLGTEGGSLCLPVTGLGLSGVGTPFEVCPFLDGYTQGLYSNSYCVIDCIRGRCPDHLPVCAMNPFFGNPMMPHEAQRYCAPGS